MAISIFALVINISCVLFIIRNNYTYKCMNIASECISSYNNKLIEDGIYNVSMNYYNTMKLDYNKHLFNITLWGRYSAIKPEYIKLLKEYDKKNI